MKFKISKYSVYFVNLLITLCEDDFVLMEYTLVYLDRKSHCLCYLVSDDSEATVYLRMFEYITYVYVSLHLSIYLSREDI